MGTKTPGGYSAVWFVSITVRGHGKTVNVSRMHAFWSHGKKFQVMPQGTATTAQKPMTETKMMEPKTIASGANMSM